MVCGFLAHQASQTVAPGKSLTIQTDLSKEASSKIYPAIPLLLVRMELSPTVTKILNKKRQVL